MANALNVRYTLGQQCNDCGYADNALNVRYTLGQQCNDCGYAEFGQQCNDCGYAEFGHGYHACYAPCQDSGQIDYHGQDHHAHVYEDSIVYDQHLYVSETHGLYRQHGDSYVYDGDSICVQHQPNVCDCLYEQQHYCKGYADGQQYGCYEQHDWDLQQHQWHKQNELREQHDLVHTMPWNDQQHDHNYDPYYRDYGQHDRCCGMKEQRQHAYDGYVCYDQPCGNDWEYSSYGHEQNHEYEQQQPYFEQHVANDYGQHVYHEQYVYNTDAFDHGQHEQYDGGASDHGQHDVIRGRCITSDDIRRLHAQGLCYKCAEPLFPNHKDICKKRNAKIGLFLEFLDQDEAEDCDADGEFADEDHENEKDYDADKDHDVDAEFFEDHKEKHEYMDLHTHDFDLGAEKKHDMTYDFDVSFPYDPGIYADGYGILDGFPYDPGGYCGCLAGLLTTLDLQFGWQLVFTGFLHDYIENG